MFWPGGGGSLQTEQIPEKSYCIAGSWSMWKDSTPMEAEGENVYGYTVVIGDNGWEQFQIWLDGSSQRVLHPGRANGYKDLPAFGPVAESEAEGCMWMIDT